MPVPSFLIRLSVTDQILLHLSVWYMAWEMVILLMNGKASTDGSSFDPIASSDNPSYDSPALTQDTWFRRITSRY